MNGCHYTVMQSSMFGAIKKANDRCLHELAKFINASLPGVGSWEGGKCVENPLMCLLVAQIKQKQVDHIVSGLTRPNSGTIRTLLDATLTSAVRTHSLLAI